MALAFTRHARDAMEKRGIAADWVRRAAEQPQRTEPDSVDAALEHRLAAIPERGGRILRVVVNPAARAGDHGVFRPQDERSTMKLTIDKEADALYLVLDEAAAVESEEVSPGIVVDYDAHNRVVGIEMLHLSKRFPQADTRRLLFETVDAAANP